MKMSELVMKLKAQEKLIKSNAMLPYCHGDV